MSAQRQIVVVSSADMMQDALYSRMVNATSDANRESFVNYKQNAERLLRNRRDYEANDVQRRDATGATYYGLSPDFENLRKLVESDAAMRMLYANNVDLRSYIYPQSQSGGKSSSETSNLKSYKKAREIAEVIYNGSSRLENVAKVTVVCSALALRSGMEVIERDTFETFLRTTAHRIFKGSQDLWNAVDEYRARSLASDGGAATQGSQMIRQLVALRSAEDVKNGRSKDVRVLREGLVLNALLKRFGQDTFTAVATSEPEHAQDDAPETVEAVSDFSATVDAPEVEASVLDALSADVEAVEPETIAPETVEAVKQPRKRNRKR